MKNRQPYLMVASVWVFIIAGLIGCSENASTNPHQLHEANLRVFGDIALSGERVVVVTNPIGAVVITGESRNGSIGWMLDKSVQAETAQRAREQFGAIELNQRDSHDTVFVSVKAPLNTASLKYAGDLSLSVPFQMTCLIEHAVYSYVYDMSALISIRNTLDVGIKRHNGSCQITLPEGNIAVEIALPPNGFCRASTKQGNILLSIPVTISAKVEAQTENGNITYTGLTFTTINMQASKLTGTLGSGLGEILLKSGQGDIQLKGF